MFAKMLFVISEWAKMSGFVVGGGANFNLKSWDGGESVTIRLQLSSGGDTLSHGNSWVRISEPASDWSKGSAAFLLAESNHVTRYWPLMIQEESNDRLRLFYVTILASGGSKNSFSSPLIGQRFLLTALWLAESDTIKASDRSRVITLVKRDPMIQMQASDWSKGSVSRPLIGRGSRLCRPWPDSFQLMLAAGFPPASWSEWSENNGINGNLWRL